jgi:chromosome segregation ATPase
MLRELTKRGYTFDDFCQRYSCNRHDLKARIRTLRRNDEKSANEAINEIVFNTKKKKGKVTGPTQVVTPEVVGQPEENQPADEVANLSVEERLEALNQQKLNLLEKSKEAAGRYADADRGYGKACNHLSELEGQISELRARLASCEAEKAETIEKQTKFLAERQSAMKERETIATELASVSEEISKLTTVQVLAFEDGTIEVVDAPDFVINEDGAEKFYDILVRDLRFKEFKMKDVSLMARLVAIRKNAEGDRRIAVTFDNEALSDLFVSI